MENENNNPYTPEGASYFNQEGGYFSEEHIANDNSMGQQSINQSSLFEMKEQQSAYEDSPYHSGIELDQPIDPYSNPNSPQFNPNYNPHTNPQSTYSQPNYYGSNSVPSAYGGYWSDDPPKLGRNWGAFMFNVIWGLSNHSYLTLLCLIPYFNIIWIFFCGAMGNKWAWESGKFRNAAEFNAVQESWNRGGFISFIASIVILVVYIILALIFVSSMIGYSQHSHSNYGYNAVFFNPFM